MGYNMGLYMGIVVKVKGGPKEFEKEAWINKNGNEQDTQFNPDSGEKHEWKTLKETRNVQPDCYIEGLDEDTFWSPEFAGAEKGWENFMYQGNESKYTTSLGDPESGFFQELPEFNKHKLIEDFKVDYQEYLEHWRSEFNNVEVAYGLLTYWS